MSYGRASGVASVTRLRRSPLRAGAAAAALLLTASYVNVLYHVSDVVGRSTTLLAVVVASLACATLLARFLDERSAVVVGGALFAGGYLLYLRSSPAGVGLLLSVGAIMRDTIALLTGVSVLRMTAVGTWALTFAPAPVFLSWYLVLRRWYVRGAAVGLVALLTFVLTGDAPTVTAAVGVIGAAATVGLGDLERRGGTLRQVDTLAIVLSIMLIVPLLLPLVPGGGAQPLAPSGDPASLEGSVVDADERMTVVGDVELSPEVRFTVRSDEPAYWRTGAYDRYTGDGWAQSGEPRAYGDGLDEPDGPSRTVTQSIVAESTLEAMPAAWKPVAVRSPADEWAVVTPNDGLEPRDALSEGDRYVVTSERPEPGPGALSEAGTDYPAGIEERYTQLPDSTPERVAEYTEGLTAEADNPYETALLVEHHLGEEKEYSLDVDQPRGDVAEEFLFEMDAGYCTYFATTMVAMLRSQNIPARFVVGYTEGERIDEDRWVVRGLDAHAWVEVYFPDVGWVAFDPTPSVRDDVHRGYVEQARAVDHPEVDTEESAESDWPPDSEDDGSDDGAESNESDDPGAGEESIDPGVGTEGQADYTDPGAREYGIAEPVDAAETEEDDEGPFAPERLVIALAAVVGLVAGARRAGVAERADYEVRVRWQGSPGSPEAAVERAFARLEAYLERRYRPRRTGESARTYVDTLAFVGVDERARRIVELYERARYGPGVSEEQAREAVRLVNELVWETTPLLRRFRS